MELKEFNKYIKQLQNFYGQELSTTEVNIWFENLKGLTVERFNYVLSEIFKTNKYMPKLSEILEMNRFIPYTANVSITKSTKNCSKCDNTGYVMYRKIIGGMPYLFSAVCDCNRQMRYDGKQCQNEKNKSMFYTPTVSETGLQIKSNSPTREEVIASMVKLKNSPIISEDVKEIIREILRNKNTAKK